MLLVPETKKGLMLPNNYVKTNGYKTFRHGRNCFGGALMMYANEHILCKFFDDF